MSSGRAGSANTFVFTFSAFGSDLDYANADDDDVFQTDELIFNMVERRTNRRGMFYLRCWIRGGYFLFWLRIFVIIDELNFNENYSGDFFGSNVEFKMTLVISIENFRDYWRMWISVRIISRNFFASDIEFEVANFHFDWEIN